MGNATYQTSTRLARKGKTDGKIVKEFLRGKGHSATKHSFLTLSPQIVIAAKTYTKTKYRGLAAANLASKRGSSFMPR